MVMQLDYTKLRPRLIKRKGLEVRHEFDIRQLDRLRDWLACDEGTLKVECQFIWPEEGNVLMDLSIQGSLAFTCQRCLEPFDFDWFSQTRLELDEQDSFLDDASDEQYEKISLSYDGSFNLLDVITDEIMLGAPERHPDGCPDNLIARKID